VGRCDDVDDRPSFVVVEGVRRRHRELHGFGPTQWSGVTHVWQVISHALAQSCSAIMQSWKHWGYVHCALHVVSVVVHDVVHDRPVVAHCAPQPASTGVDVSTSGAASMWVAASATAESIFAASAG
jgi:hypothetical protein